MFVLMALLAQDPDSPSLQAMRYQTPVYTVYKTLLLSVRSFCSKLVQNGMEYPTAISPRHVNEAASAPVTNVDQPIADLSCLTKQFQTQHLNTVISYTQFYSSK